MIFSNIDVIIAGSIGEVPIVLAKPQAYMNFSGESVGYGVRFHLIFRPFSFTSLGNTSDLSSISSQS